MTEKMMLATKNVTKKFKREVIVQDVSLSVPENTIYGLLGPNGAGKSTILKMMTGIFSPTSGEVLFQGRPFQREDLHEIGSLIEYPALYENLTAWENLKVRATLLNIPAQRMTEVLELVHLTNTNKKKVKNFSLGMKQRLGIALALLHHPELLILDEPMNGLDPVGIEELRQLIKSLPKKGVTVIVSSHLLSEIEQVADRIGIVVAGRMAYEGDLEKTENVEKLFMNVIQKSRLEGVN